MIGETGTDPGELQRSLEEGLTQALPFLIPIEVTMISLIKHNSRNHLFLTDILRVIYCVNGYYLVITLSLLVKHPETVSGLKSEEVNRPGIDLRKRHNQLRGAASRQHIVPKGRFDRHIGVLSCALDRFGPFPDLKRIGRAEHHTVNLVALIDDIFQHRPDSASCSACVKLVICLDLVAGSHLTDIENCVAGSGHLHRIVHRKPQTAHQSSECLTIADSILGKIQGIRPEAQRRKCILHFLNHF